MNTATTRHTGIDYFVSNDGGLKWHRTYSGNTVIFPSVGTDLRWKAELRTLSPSRTPILSQVSLVEVFVDTDLSGLSLSSGTLSPAFAPEITSYATEVANAAASITVTPTLVDANATVTVNGSSVTSGQPSADIPLAVGENIVTVVVSGTNPKTTTVTVDRTVTIGGSVSGLAAGNQVVLRNNNSDDLAVSSNANFTFGTELTNGSGYAVTVLSDPTTPSQTCELLNEIGNVDGANVTDIEVTCVTDRFTVGGTVSGLQGGQLVLQNNRSGDRAITADGVFTFGAQDDGTGYAVTVASQPGNPTQFCSVLDGSGTLMGNNITSVIVNCVSAFTVGGTVSGLKLPG
ncbi:MAG TPA: cadherin-like beta sandwich domain-containing protein, partial [candidate division Zixibacteria bacterium]|nr:cadherin-like beta sandwich domain-containing protein [candidate division Zixibacteria bacterium]